MGLPEILIEFKTQGTTAIQRSARGIVALILKDDTDTTFDTKVYSSIDEIDAADWTATNKDYIEKAFLGVPSKIIVERIATTATDYNAALDRLKNKKWNYLAIPGIQPAEVATIATWIKTQRDNYHKTFKAALPNYAADHEGIINFAATYYALPEVESITESADPDADIDAGKLILIGDINGPYKIGRAVNSLTTTTATKGEEFKKIKIVEGVDMVRDDIRNTFENYYVGKVVNHYDNKVLFLAAVNAYFKELERLDVLDPNYDNLTEIDVDAQRLYLMGKGIDVSALSEQQIKEYNTGSKVFAKARVKFLDAMEDLQFAIYM